MWKTTGDKKLGGNRLVIELHPRDDFWLNAFSVEWSDQFPQRKLVWLEARQFIADSDWAGDLERVAAQCLCKLVRGPANPDRRAWIRFFSPSGDKK
jgi:hypothetical protein